MIKTHFRIGLVASILGAGAIQAADNPSTDVEKVLQSELQRAHKFIETVDDCSLSHGYICEDISESDFSSVKAQDAMLSGNKLKAWYAAYGYFLNLEELTDIQKNLKHYKVGILETDQNYTVRFQGLLLPSIDAKGERQGLMRASIGGNLEIFVSKNDFTLLGVKWDR